MPVEGYTTISVKPSTRERVRERRDANGQTTDELVKSLFDDTETDD